MLVEIEAEAEGDVLHDRSGVQRTTGNLAPYWFGEQWSYYVVAPYVGHG